MRHGVAYRRRTRNIRGPRGRRTGHGVRITQVALAACGLAVPVLLLVGYAATNAAGANSNPAAAPAPAEPRTGGTQPTPASTASVVEGRDYSLQTFQGKPVHWACDKHIPVAIEGTAPKGAEAALKLVVSRLRMASGLPLVVENAAMLQPSGKDNILIRYVESHNEAYGMEIAGDTLGEAGPRFGDANVIRAGRAIVRNDSRYTIPTTPRGQQVLMHELGHTLGLGHAAPAEPEVMAPSSDTDAKPVLGPGDRYALQVVGCSSTSSGVHASHETAPLVHWTLQPDGAEGSRSRRAAGHPGGTRP